MKIQTGRGTIPLITLIAIWSISALTSLPGLAVSPILGDLTKIFPKATDLDIQMLTSLPSLLIIPFILLGGKLTEKVDFVRILNRTLALCSKRYLVSDLQQNVAINRRECPAGHRLRTDYSAVHGINLKILCGYLPGETIRIEFCHYQFYIGDSYCRDRISGGSQLAFAVFGLSAPFDFYSAGRSLKREPV